MDWSLVAIVLQLIFLEGILSIDNAAVLGAMVSDLPDDRPIDWPQRLRTFGHRLQRLLGNQRTAALRVGLLGAYLGRGIMLLLADLVVHLALLRILGALYLLKLAIDNLGRTESNETNAHVHPIAEKTFWQVVLAVELADLAFSLDNVVAAIAVSDKILIVMLGVAIGIVLMRFAAGWFSYLIEREPILKTAAYVLVLNIALELLLEEFAGLRLNDLARFGISAATLLAALLYARVKILHVIDPALAWLAQGCAQIDQFFDWLAAPIVGLIKWLPRLIQQWHVR
jgi:tellurite resistance protein TerC